jgi:hypothetical protein
LFQKRIYSIFLGTLVGKRKQTIFKKRWFDITNNQGFRIRIGSGFYQVGESEAVFGFRGAKMTPKSRIFFEISRFEVQDVPF